MLNLVRKDIRASALYLCGILPVMALTSMGGLRGGLLFFWWALITAAVLVATPLALDWSEGADRFLHSLPVSRRDVVRARYVSSLVLSGASFAVSLVVAILFTWIVVSRGGAWPGWMSIEAALAFVIVASVALAVYLPCVFRFGFGIGSAGFGAIVITGIVVIEIIGARLAGSGGPVSAGAGAASAGIPGGAAARLAIYAVETLGPAGAVVAVPGVAAVLLWISMWLSMRLHQPREF